MKLKWNLYGLKQAAFNWNELLTAGLKSIGFKQSEFDPCLFLHAKIICIIYVDDTIFFSKTNEPIEQVINMLKENFESPYSDMS